MPMFLNENVAVGLPENAIYQVGSSDVDTGVSPEQAVDFSWFIDPVVSFIVYQCWIEYQLDSGIVVHRVLPQISQDADSLAGGNVTDADFAKIISGVNLVSKTTFQDIVQRMANSRYRFCLKGYCERAGWLPTPPGMTGLGFGDKIIPVIPDDSEPQRVVGPIILSNNSGVPIYGLSWRFWYTCAVPPKMASPAPTNLSEQIGQVSPSGPGLPVSGVDPSSVKSGAPSGFGSDITRRGG